MHQWVFISSCTASAYALPDWGAINNVVYHPPFTPGLLPSAAYGHPGVLWGHCERLPLVRSYHGKPRAGRPSRAAHAAYVSTENVIAHKGAAAMAGKKPGPLAGSPQARHGGTQPWQGTGPSSLQRLGRKVVPPSRRCVVQSFIARWGRRAVLQPAVRWKVT